MKTADPYTTHEKTLDHIRKHGPLMLGVLSGGGQYDRPAEELIEQGDLVEVRKPDVFVCADGIVVTQTFRYAANPGN